MRYSKRHTGRDVILTKLDVLDECKTIRVCTSYLYTGPTYHIGRNVTLNPGDVLREADPDYDIIKYCAPQYDTFAGWLSPLGECRHERELPPQLRKLVDYIIREADLNVVMLSVGPDRKQTVVMNEKS